MGLARSLDEISNKPPQWRDRPDRKRTPHERWGHDHWSLLAFVEECAVTASGQIDWDRVTLSRRNWPMLWAARNPWEVPAGTDVFDRGGLRNAGDIPVQVAAERCGVDTLMDLVDHQLVTIEMPPVSPTGKSYLRPDGHALNDPSPQEPLTGWAECRLMPWARFSLTDRGWKVAGELRKHLSIGGEFHQFSLPVKLLEAVGS